MTWSVDRLVAGHARDHGDEPAIDDGDVSLTWAALDALASSAAASVNRAGVATGERVALIAPSGGHDVATLLGILRAGAVAALVPAGLTARETATALEVMAPALVLSRPGIGARDTPSPALARDLAAPAVIVLTSGTTGLPKGVVLSGTALAASADAWLAVLPPVTGWALPLGLAHVAGLGVLWRAIRQRVPVRIVPSNDADALLAALADTVLAASHVSLVPAQLARLLDAARGTAPPTTLRALLLGGGAIPPELVVRASLAGWPVMPTFGLSECGSGVTALGTEEAIAAPDTAGRPLPGVTLTIAEPDADGIGEIIVESPAAFSGYLGEASRAPGEPVRTGDLGRIDEAGRLTVVDRRIDRIVRGGENIDPAEVEAALQAHPAVADAAVVGRPDAVWGQVPVAAIVLRPGAGDPGDEAILACARESIAGFKVPAVMVHLGALPRTPGGKLRREAVRALLAGEPAGVLARPDGDAIGWRITGAGPLGVLLLHGTLSTSAQLDRLAAALAAPGDVTVHALDRRGSGSSRLAHPRPLDIASHVEDTIAYLDARGIDRAAVVGVSFGGVLGLELAARHPDRVTAVVAYEPPYGPLSDPASTTVFQELSAAVARAHRDGGAPAAAETFLRAVAGSAAWHRLSPRARASLEREGDSALADAGLTGLEPDGLVRIRARVAILTGGASDPFYAPIADALAARIPGARRDTLEDLTHPSPITRPGIVGAVVRSCLELPA